MIDVIVVLVILLILIAAYRLICPRTDAGRRRWQSGPTVKRAPSMRVTVQDHPLDK